MTNLKNLAVLMILTSCLSSCRNKQLRLITKQCTLVQVDTRYECACRDYQFSYEYLGSVGEAEISDMRLCETMVGYPNYDDVAAFNEKVWREMRR